MTFLKDRTGNRRFWPIRVGIQEPAKSLWADDVYAEIDRVWGEALAAWNKGESL